jgi:hypothetical protein
MRLALIALLITVLGGAAAATPAAQRYERTKAGQAQAFALNQYKDALDRAASSNSIIAVIASGHSALEDSVIHLREAQRLRTAYIRTYGKDVGLWSRWRESRLARSLIGSGLSP